MQELKRSWQAAGDVVASHASWSAMQSAWRPAPEKSGRIRLQESKRVREAAEMLLQIINCCREDPSPIVFAARTKEILRGSGDAVSNHQLLSGRSFTNCTCCCCCCNNLRDFAKQRRCCFKSSIVVGKILHQSYLLRESKRSCEAAEMLYQIISCCREDPSPIVFVARIEMILRSSGDAASNHK